MKKAILLCMLFAIIQGIFGQIVEPTYIKSVQLKPLKKNNFSIVVPIGSTLELSFDDLEGDQNDCASAPTGRAGSVLRQSYTRPDSSCTAPRHEHLTLR